jgi:hypothetical protein
MKEKNSGQYYSSKGQLSFSSLRSIGFLIGELGECWVLKEANRGKRSLSFSLKGIMEDNWENWEYLMGPYRFLLGTSFLWRREIRNKIKGQEDRIEPW